MIIALSSSVDRGPRKARSLRPLLMMSGLALVLAGCTDLVDRHEIVGSVPLDYRTSHPIAIEEMIETFDLPVGVDMARLTRPAAGNVVGFAQKFVDSGSASVAIVAPTGSPNAGVAAGIALEVRDLLLRTGVSRHAIQFRLYPAGPDESNAPLRLAYNRITAHTAPCGAWPDQISRTPENRNYYNFGCATQQNLAAIVENPLDLLYPRGITPADAVRRAKVLERYRNGDGFQGDYGREPGGAIAQGVGSK